METCRFLNRDTPAGIFQAGSGYGGMLYWVVDEGPKHAVQLFGTGLTPAFTAFPLEEHSIAWGEWRFPTSAMPELFIDADCDGRYRETFYRSEYEGAPGQIFHSDGASILKVFSCTGDEFQLQIPPYDLRLCGNYDFSGYCDSWTLHGGEEIGSVFTRHDWELQHQINLRRRKYFASTPRRYRRSERRNVID